MTDIVKVKQSGVQVFPQTHWNAVEGKPETIKGIKEILGKLQLLL